jgi:type II secretory ATPase GspE/PulE/Tfp pilus assembly ATPase PilB-like protein
MGNPYLEIKTAAGRRQLVVRDDEPLTIGRHVDNKLVLDDTMASRFHCVIEKARGGQYVLRDLGASNGTRVNGKLVRTVALAPGDVVTIGNTSLVLVIPDSMTPASPPGGLLAEAEDALQVADEPIPLTEELIEDDSDIEELTEEDLVPDAGEDDRIQVEHYDGPAPIVQAGLEDYESKLWSMAEMVPHKPFVETDIALLDARGRVAHPAGKAIAPGPRQPQDLLRLWLLVGLRARATDIHLEPRENNSHGRIRVDGVMVDAADFPPPIAQRLVGVVKVLSEIDLAQRSIVQEGNFSARVPALPGQQADSYMPSTWPGQPPIPVRRVDYRVSFAPSVNGQKLVIRALDPSVAPGKLEDLQLPEPIHVAMAEAIEQESGMVLVSGPTGSGKTSTLYALVRSIDTSQRNVVTIEDPVEIRIENATQIPVDDEKGNTFPALLRSVLRQDPDVILVGEVRDAETARVAMQASITGHLVFSTVHTKDTLGTVFRLLDLGVEPYLLSQGLQVVLAQRLVRQLCPFCKRSVPATPQQIAKMGKAGEGVSVVFTPGGCGRCLGTGYAGRRAFFEILRNSDALRDAMSHKPSQSELRQALEGTDFVHLSEAGYRLAAAGEAAFEEIEKAVGR